MNCADLQVCLSQASWVDGATVIAAVAAIVAAVSACFSYLLSKRIYDEIKSDEVVIAGPVHRVGYMEKDHDDPVVRITLFNRSSRKAFVTGVKAFDQRNEQIPVTWSDAASHIGNIENPTGLIGLVDAVNLYIRRNDGEPFRETSLRISHSFSKNEMVVTFDPYQGWWQ